MKRFRVVLLLALVAALGLSALAQAQVTLSYRFWDINQAPAMEAIARAFEEKNPGVKVEIEVILGTILDQPGDSGNRQEFAGHFLVECAQL